MIMILEKHCTKAIENEFRYLRQLNQFGVKKYKQHLAIKSVSKKNIAQSLNKERLFS